MKKRKTTSDGMTPRDERVYRENLKKQAPLFKRNLRATIALIKKRS